MNCKPSLCNERICNDDVIEEVQGEREATLENRASTLRITIPSDTSPLPFRRIRSTLPVPHLTHCSPSLPYL